MDLFRSKPLHLIHSKKMRFTRLLYAIHIGRVAWYGVWPSFSLWWLHGGIPELEPIERACGTSLWRRTDGAKICGFEVVPVPFEHLVEEIVKVPRTGRPGASPRGVFWREAKWARSQMGMAQNERAGVKRVFVFGSIYQGAILVPLF